MTVSKGTRALGHLVPEGIIGRHLAHSVPAAPSNMRGCPGSWSPDNVVGTWTVPQCTWPFQARYRGPEGPSYVCMKESAASCGRCWIRRRPPGGGHLFALTWKSTGRRPGHRSPVRLAGVWIPCVRVPGGTASRNRGGNKLPPSYVCMKEYRGLPRPRYAVWIGLAWLPTEASKLASAPEPAAA